MSKSPLTLAVLCLTLGTLSAQTIDTWVTSQGAMFEASVKTVVPGQVTFILKDGREQPVPLANLSDRSRAKLIESLGLGTAPVPVAAATTPPPAATAATTPATPATPTTPTAAPAAMTPATAPVAGAAIEASIAAGQRKRAAEPSSRRPILSSAAGFRSAAGAGRRYADR
jgi:hypothetical protein